MSASSRCRVVLCAALVLVATPVLAADAASDALRVRSYRFADASGADQVLALLGIGALDDESLDHGVALEAFLRHAVDAAKTPLVAARARWELARMLARRGVNEPLPVIDAGIVVGPFSAELGAELSADEKLGPEAKLLREPILADATFPSGLPAQVAHVHRVAAFESGGVVPLGALVRPDTRTASFLIFAVHVPRATNAVLRLGSNGAVVAWLDGRKIGAHTGERPLAFDADAYPAPLAAGLNRFVVRVATSERAAELVVRLTDEHGAALTLAAADPLLAPVAPAKVADRPPATWKRLLSGLARDAYLVNDGVDGVHPDEPCARLDAQRDLTWLPFSLACAADDDAQRRLLEARLSKADREERIALETQLGELQLRGRTPAVGEARLAEVTKLGTSLETWRARVRLVELNADRGFVQAARAELASLVALAPSLRVREAAAHLAQRAGRPEEALRMLTALHDELPGDVALLRQVASLLRGRGRREDLGAALQLLAAKHDLRDDEAFVVERAELLEGLGRPDDAARELSALLVRTPDDPRIEERLGRLLLAYGHKEALSHLRLALELKPQSPELRTLLSDIDATRRGGGLRHHFGVDVAALRERTARDALGRTDPARALYDATTVRVHENGLQESFVERVVEVHDVRGAEQEGTVFVRYAPDTQTVDVELARVYKASGEVVEAASVEERDLSEPWAGLYYDVRAQVIHLSGVEPGDVVHVAYTVSDRGRRNELGDAFCELHMLQESMVRLESTYRLIAPLGRAMYFDAPRAGGAVVAPLVTTDDRERTWAFTARDVPKLVPEPGMAGDAELGAHVSASTFAKWADVASFYRGLSIGQLEPDAAIRRAAHDAVGKKTRLEDKVAAIYDLVVRSTRYVGLEFGVHGYQPYKVAQVWARRFGDCKDKASLLVAMLKEVGVPATLVLLRTLHEGDVARSPPSLALFDHAIAYVPALDRYLDGTAELSGSTELPSEDQGTLALHIADGVVHTTPVSGPDGARSDETLRIDLSRDGSAKLDLERHVAGVAAEAWRRLYLPAAQRTEHLEQTWAQRSPGTVVRRVDVPHVDERERPFELSARLELPRLARVDGDALAVPLLAREPNLLSTLAPLSARTHDLLLSHAFVEHERVTLSLPPGIRAVLPEDVVVDSAFGRFSLHAALDGGRVRIDAETTLAVRRVRVADYAAFRAFLASIDRVVGSELRVEQTR